MTNLDAIGLIGSIALGICNLPQAILSVKRQSSEGVSPLTVVIGWGGCFCLFIYLLLKIHKIIQHQKYFIWKLKEQINKQTKTPAPSNNHS